MKKIIVIGVIALFIVVGFQSAFANNIMENNPPEAPSINGHPNGTPGQLLCFTFNSSEPDGDDVRFYIDWGDCTYNVTDSVPSGTDKTVSHIWDVEDTYTITAYSEDETGSTSFPATFTVIIPRDKATKNALLWGLFERFQFLERLLYFIL